MNVINVYQQLCQIEISVSDISRALIFYENVFGWKKVPAEMAHYHVLHVEPESTFGIALVETPAANFQNMGSKTVLYLKVPDYESYIETAEQFGGKILRKDFHLPGYGKVAQIADPDQNRWGFFIAKQAPK